MKKNMGKLDRTLRIIVGLIVIAAGIYFESWWGALGLIPVLTSSLSWCPLYIPFKWNTSENKQ